MQDVQGVKKQTRGGENMDWDLDDSRSIYPQLKELIKRGIITGEYAPGSAFPTVRELASDAGVNRNTMQRAMAELENEGLLITNRTAGRTVTTDLSLIEQMRRELAEQQVDTFLQEMRSLGYSLQGALAEVAARIGAAARASSETRSGSIVSASDGSSADCGDDMCHTDDADTASTADAVGAAETADSSDDAEGKNEETKGDYDI